MEHRHRQFSRTMCRDRTSPEQEDTLHAASGLDLSHTAIREPTLNLEIRQTRPPPQISSEIVTKTVMVIAHAQNITTPCRNNTTPYTISNGSSIQADHDTMR